MTRAIEHFIGLGRANGSTAARIASRAALWLLAGSVSASTLFGQCAPSTLAFTNQAIASGSYQAISSIAADAGNGSGATTGAITNVSGSIVSFVETNEAIVALPPLTAETRPQFFETAVLPHAILDISGPVGSNCVIAAAQTLSSGAVWETRASLALTNGTARWIDTNGTGASQYYYKISLAKP